METGTKNYFGILSFDSLMVEILATKRDCPLLVRDGKDSDRYETVTKWCNPHDRASKEDFKKRRLPPNWKGVFSVDRGTNIWQTPNGIIYDGERDEFVSRRALCSFGAFL